MRLDPSGILVADGSDRAWIEMTGADAPDFLQRVLTSDVHRLQPGAGQWSAMLDGKGHWIADLLLYALPHAEDTPSFGIDLPAERLQVVLDKFEMMHFGESMRWDPVPFARLLQLVPEGEAREGELSIQAQDGGWLLQRPDRGLACWESLRRDRSVEELLQEATAGGAALLDADALERLRILAKRPRWGIDFDSETTLPNCNEWHRASIRKGCYAGQEVIAKIHTYGEAPRQLCHLDFGTHEVDLSGAELRTADGRRMGRVSSWAWDAVDGRASGLGMLRRRAAVEGGEVLAFPADAPEGAEGVPAAVHLPEKVFG